MLPKKPAQIELGKVLEGPSGRPLPGVLSILLKALLTHMTLEGSSGVGKTQLIKWIVFQMIRLRHGLMALDPMGSFVPSIIDYLAAMNCKFSQRERAAVKHPRLQEHLRAQRVAWAQQYTVIDFDDANVSGVRFNLLRTPPGLTHADTAASAIKVIGRLVEGEIAAQPRRQLVLRSFCGLVSALGGTLSDVISLLALGNAGNIEQYIEKAERQYAEGQLSVPFRRDICVRWLSGVYAHLSPRLVADTTGSSWTILQSLLCEPRIALFLTESAEGNFSFEELVNGPPGRSCFIHFPKWMDVGAQRALGALFSSGVVQVALRRSDERVRAGEYQHFSIVGDEASSFLTPEARSDIAVLRQKLVSLTLAWQSGVGQFGTPELQTLLAGIRGNAGISLVMRSGLQDAEALAPKLYMPRGLMEKRRYDEVTKTESESWANTTTKSVSKTIALAFGTSEGTTQTLSLGRSQTLSLGRSQGIGRVITRGLSLSHGQGVTQAVSHSTGLVLSTTNGQTTVSGGGSATSKGTTTGSTNGQGLSFTPGPSMNLDSLTHGASHGPSNSTFHGDSTSESIANIVSKTQSLAQMQSSSVAKSTSCSESEAHSQTETKALSESIARSLSEMESFMEALAQSYSQAIGQQQSMSETRTESTGHTEGGSQQRGGSQGRSTKQIIELYSVGEETQIRAQEIAGLPARTVIAWLQGPDGSEVYKLRTPDVPQDFLTKFGPKDYRQDFLELAAPAKALPVPNVPLLARANDDAVKVPR